MEDIKMKKAIVLDEAYLTEHVRMNLEELRMTVDDFVSSADVTSALERETYDLFIVEPFYLGARPGNNPRIDLIKRVSQDTPVIVTSTQAPILLGVFGLVRGEHYIHHFEKPYDSDKLIETVGEICGIPYTSPFV